jgi:hypothetical protein
MRLRLALFLAMVTVSVTGATTIDVSSQTSAVVHTGDALVFQLLSWNFAVDATAFGMPANPTDVNFALVSAPLGGAGEFAATLESADRSVSVPFGDLTFGTGYFQGSGYTGAVSTLQGYLSVSPVLSEGIFNGSSAFIVLRNAGPDVTLGLASYGFRQDLYANLSEGPLSVGVLPGLVDLETRTSQAHLTNLGGTAGLAAGSQVPEPRSGRLLVGGGALLCVLSALLARLSRSKPLPREKSTVCIL